LVSQRSNTALAKPNGRGFDSWEFDGDDAFLRAVHPAHITVQSLVDPHSAPIAQNVDAILIPVADLELRLLSLKIRRFRRD
jgi:hypothetical protein